MSENEAEIVNEVGATVETVAASDNNVENEQKVNESVVEDSDKNDDEPEEEVFGVVDPNAIISAIPVVGKRGRKSRAGNDEFDSDDAYGEDDFDEDGSDRSDDEFDSEDEYDEGSDEDSGDEYDDDDGREYGRSHNRSDYISKPQLSPFLSALTDNMLLKKPAPSADGTEQVASPNTALTAAQLQEMARNAISSLASSSTPTMTSSNRTLPILLPRTPQAAENIRENVSHELKQSIASMLLNPDLRAALLAKLQANKTASANIAPKPQYSDKFINYNGPSRQEEQSLSASRARRSTKAVDYSNYFNEDAFDEFVDVTNTDAVKPVRSANASNSGTPGKRRGRPAKHHNPSREAQVQEIKKKARHMYDEGDGEDSDYDEDDAASVGSTESNEPGVEKILSHRKVNGKDEFFVKFHGLAYAHAAWISRDEIASENAGSSRITRFLSKPLSYYHFDDKNIINPEFTMIDRIVYGWKHPSIENEKIMTHSYLVKWKALPLDQATWEKESFVVSLSDGPDAIKQYEGIPNPWKKRENALPVSRRPDASQWTKFEESPVYKSQNYLRPYQLEGLNWLVYCWMHKQSCIIADEMGLGKTVQSVSFLDLIYNRFNVRGPFLVIAPLSTLPHWQREFEAWTDLRVLLYHGTEAARDVMFEYEFFYKDPNTDQIIPGLCKFDVILTTYEMCLSGQHHLRNIIWRVGIFDEAHRLKNKVSKAAEVLQTFQIEHKVLLTGTPIQNSLDELFSLLNFLQPNRFFSLEMFLKDYGNLRRSEDVEKLQALLKPLMLRRLKEDVEKSIPVKEETIIEVELTSIQKRYYRAILEKNFGFLMKGAKSNNMPNLINTMMELRKCCIHPYLIKGKDINLGLIYLRFFIVGAEDRIIDENGAMNDHEAQMMCMVQSSGKLVLVDKLLKKLREGGHKVLIFSQMTRCLDILSDFLRWRGYPCERIDGAVKGDERQASIDRYCNPNNNSFVFLLCTKAGGVGINLTAADTVVIFDSDWNPQNDLQAQARCHRIGQTKSVKIYRLITRNTYEREMFDRAGMKLGLDKAILQKMGPESTELEDMTESSATPQMSKTHIEDLLKKGAYGILMENDDSSMKFMDEDIDSILERRTTVIRHDSGAKESSRSAMDGSIFSKASFAATADDLDLDMDDPNFWELWAKKMNLEPSKVQSAGVSAAVDEARIRRVLRRLLSHSKNEFSQLLAAFPCTLQEAESEAEPEESKDEVKLWTEEERLSLMRLLLRFGLTSFDRIRPYFADRNHNDLLAATKILLKTCIEQIAEEEPKFKEDCDKLLLSKIEFDRYDKKTVRQAALEDGEEAGAVTLASAEFSKADIPYSGASHKQIVEFRSFYKDDNCPESYRQLIQEHARNILITLQTVELLRKTLEDIGGSVGKSGGIETFGALNIPNSAGSGPATWWDRDEDLALLIGTIRYGFGEFADIKADSSLAWQHQIQTTHVEFPEDEKIFERIFKLVVAIEKKNRINAKLAIHTMNFGGGRRRAAFEDDEETPVVYGNGRKSRFNSNEDEDEEEYEEEAGDEKRGRGRPKRKKTYSSAEARFLATWSKAERAEFNRLVNAYGLPPMIEDSVYDWSVFRELMSAGKVSIEDQSEMDEAAEEPGVNNENNNAKLMGKSDEDLNKYLEIYLVSCSQASERPARRRGRPSKNGRIVDEDGEEFEDDNDLGPVPSDSLIEMAPERAKKSLSRIELFSKIRSPELLEQDNLAEILSEARRSSGLPRWWLIGPHDAALLKGAAIFGFGRPDLIVKEIPEFKEVLDQINSGDLSVRESRRKTPTISDVPSDASGNSSGTYSVVDGIDVNKLNWPNELIILRRLELIVEMLTETGKPQEVEIAGKKGGKKSSNVKSQKSPKEKKEKEPKAPKPPKSPKPAKIAKTTNNPPRSAKTQAVESMPTIPSADSFPEIHPGRTKRQRTLTDFGFNKSK